MAAADERRAPLPAPAEPSAGPRVEGAGLFRARFFVLQDDFLIVSVLY